MIECVSRTGKQKSYRRSTRCRATARAPDASGNVIDTLQEAIEKGVQTGGMLGDSSSACLPYEFEACDHPCQVPGTIAESAQRRAQTGRRFQKRK